MMFASAFYNQPPPKKIRPSTKKLIDMLERNTTEFEDIKQFIDSHPDIEFDGQHPDHGFTAIHACAITGQHDALKYLIEKGAPIDITNVLAETPLHIAAMYHHARCVEVLLSKGARPDVSDRRGQTALQLAQKQPLIHRTRDGPDAGARCAALLKTALAEKKGSDKYSTAAELRAKGNALFKQERYEEAIKQYTMSAALFFDYRTFVNRAAAYLYLADFDAAFKDTNQVLGTKPGLAVIHLFRSMQCLIYRDFPRARLYAEDGLRKCKDSPKTPAFALLERIKDRLKSEGIGTTVANSISPFNQQAALRVAQGSPAISCNLCYKNIPADSDNFCPACACDPRGRDIGDPATELSHLFDDLVRAYSDEELAAMLPQKKNRLCSNCGKVPGKVMRCARCLAAIYCDVACQKAHWLKHKSECSSPKTSA